MFTLPNSFCDPPIYITTDTVDYFGLKSLLSEFSKHVDIIERVSPKNIYYYVPFTSGLTFVDMFF